MVQAETVRAVHGAARVSRIAGSAKLRLLRNAALAAAFAALPLLHAAAFATLPDIVTSTTVPANGDVNPYGVAIVPNGFPTGSAINPGDILVSNFNNMKNLQGTGSTIIKLTPNGVIAPSGTASVFYNGGTGHGLTTALGILQRGYVLVGNVPTTDGTSKTVKPGALLVLDHNGKQISSIPASTLDGPWDLAIVDSFDHAQVFVSNVLNGTVSRLELAVGKTAVTVKRATVIATGYAHVPNAGALLLGPTGLAYDQFKDVLYVASTGDNAIYAISHAGAAATSVMRGKLISKDPHLRGPLALALAPNGDLLTANGDAVNADVKHPSEIVELTETGQFVHEFNVDSGQGGAFGLAIAGSPSGAFHLVVIDDVTNSLAVLPLNQ
jgi:hypothetical protein